MSGKKSSNKKSDLIELKKTLEQKELEYEIQSISLATKQLSEASNMVSDTDVDSGSWVLSGRSTADYLDPSQHIDMLNACYKLYHENVHARAIVRGLVKFTLGKGPTLIPDDKNPKVKEAWNEFCKRNRFNKREKEIATRTFRDGECFLRFFEDKQNGEVKVRFIRSTLIKNPEFSARLPKGLSFGILTGENDIEDIKKYYKCSDDGKLSEIIDAKDIEHIKIFADSDQKRGTSIYRVCAKRIRQYDEWLEDRIVLNKVRSAITLVKKSNNPKKIREDNLSSRRNSSDNMSKAFKKGTIITASKDMEYQLLSPNINAADVADDGRAMLLSIAAAVGFPEMIFTSDFCHDMETEVLTDHGFVDPKVAYIMQYKIATIDGNTGKLFYDTPIDWIFSKYEDDMYIHEGNSLNFSVTKNHEMLLRSGNLHDLQKYRIDRSIEGFRKYTLGDNSSCKWINETALVRNFIEPAENSLDKEFINVEFKIEDSTFGKDKKFNINDMVSFIAWFISGGNVDKENGFINIYQSFANKDNLYEIDQLLKRLSIEYSKYDISDLNRSKSVFSYWKMNDKKLAVWLRVNCDCGIYDEDIKRIPRFIFELPIRLREKFLDILIKGSTFDCTYDNNKRNRRFYNGSEKLLNDVQRLAFELGYNTTSVINEDICYVDISDGHNCLLQRNNIKKTPYKGDIWCITTNSGLLVTRRKGRILISGNSNANYSSSLVAQNPFVREIEEWQDFFEETYERLFERVIKAKISAGKLPLNTKTTCRVDFPPMLRDDIDKLAKAYETLYKYKISSKKTWRGKMGLDDDVEKLQIESEEAEYGYGNNPNNIVPGGKQGALPGQYPPTSGKFNLPMSPVNQYGHAIAEAVLKKDYNKAAELAEELDKYIYSISNIEEE